MELYIHSPNTPAWCGAELKKIYHVHKSPPLRSEPDESSTQTISLKSSLVGLLKFLLTAKSGVDRRNERIFCVSHPSLEFRLVTSDIIKLCNKKQQNVEREGIKRGGGGNFKAPNIM
jgi:hypothetical protein